ncbi:MAG: PDZ domain-containing protein [Syntrophus sp. (in: bacteria)]
MMDRFRLIGHPIVIFVLVCIFVFVYFVYLKGVNPLTLIAPSVKTGAETEMNAERQIENNVAPLVGPVGQQQDPLNPQNPVNQPNQLGVPGNPNPVPTGQPNQNAAVQQPIAATDKALIEGHWIGGEVIPLTAMIAKANSIPPDVMGVLIDEVTLLSAEAGLLAGDVITAINGKKVTDLKSFQQATKDVAQLNRATVSVYSGGKNKDIVVFSTEALGIAQMEGAPMIQATARSPHAYYGACNKCHVISKNTINTKTSLNSRNALNPNELLKDAGDNLTKIAPNIRRGTPPPHRNRGTCTLCHVVL